MDWLDKVEYPFRSNFFAVDGSKMHYVDEGNGQPVVMVHGTPEWSFGYRYLIKGLSGNFRCIAPDLLGMGLSDKPRDADYSCKAHAQRLEGLIAGLGLKHINIIANDFGGSIALSYAINHAHNVHHISLFNTWMWSVKDDKHYAAPAKVMRTFLGKVLYKQFNFPVNVIMPQAFGDKSKLSGNIHKHYKLALPTAKDRSATYAFARELIDASSWWDSLWAQLDKIKTKPFLFFWGMKDKFIPPYELAKWQNALPSARVIKFENAGHFVQEEEPEKMVMELKKFFG
ncbi:MAG TPA: alpha/beta fold hydrolase [Chitinophagales bacterium]|nr:alpha/beta fold hydrolase [Chitinophagales bacterium]